MEVALPFLLRNGCGEVLCANDAMKQISNGLTPAGKNSDKVVSYLYERDDGFYRINYVSESYWDEFQDERARGKFGLEDPVEPLENPVRPRYEKPRRQRLVKVLLALVNVFWVVTKFSFGLLLDLIRISLYLIFGVLLLNLVGILLMGGGRRW